MPFVSHIYIHRCALHTMLYFDINYFPETQNGQMFPSGGGNKWQETRHQHDRREGVLGCSFQGMLKFLLLRVGKAGGKALGTT